MAATPGYTASSAVLSRKIALALPPLIAAQRRLDQHPDPAAAWIAFLGAGYGSIRASVPLLETARDRARELSAADPVAAGLVDYLRRHAEEERGHERPFENLPGSPLMGVGVHLLIVYSSSELGDFGEVELVDLHSRDHHIESLLTGGANRRRERLHVREQFDYTLVEAEVPHSSHDVSAIDEEGSIASHPSHDLLIGVDFADVP